MAKEPSFKQKTPGWSAEGVEPSAEFKSQGYVAGYKPPAGFFNWFWTRVSDCLEELQLSLGDYAGANEEDKTRLAGDIAKKLDASRFTAEGIKQLLNAVSGLNADTLDGKHAADFAQSGHVHPVASTSAAGFMAAGDKTNLDNHVANKGNPHGVTRAQLGAAAASDLTSHTGNKNNPHGVTKAQLSLGNCENTADTNKNVATARTLATPRTIQTNLASGLAASFNGSANIAPGITGVLGPGNGGTGYTSLQAARNAMGLGNTLSVLPVANGGTGATYAAAARENLQILVGSKVVATDVSGNVVIIAGRPSDAVSFSNGDANALPYNFSFSNFFLNGLWYVHIKNPSGAPHAYATVRINYLLIY